MIELDDISKLQLSKDDVLIVSFKDARMYARFLKGEWRKDFFNMFKKALGSDISIIVLPPHIKLGVIGKKEIAPWVAFNEFTGESGLPDGVSEDQG